MISFLFWNLQKKSLLDRVARIVEARDIDVLILAECEIDPREILARLNASGGKPYSLPASESEKIRIFTRFPESSLVEAFEDPSRGLTLRQLKVGRPPYLLLAAVHLPSRINWSRDDQTLGATTIARSIERKEDDLGYRRTILVGDLNMNPFDPGLVGAQALNAVMTRDLALRTQRQVQGTSYRHFYNPMWSFFGDRTDGPAGSFYHASSAPSNHYWNIYDQVLLRPDLIDALDEVRILDSDGHETLLTRAGLPSKTSGSDHLPLYFRLDL